MALSSLSVFKGLEVGKERGDKAKRTWSGVGIGKVEKEGKRAVEHSCLQIGKAFN
jgi:hypothetical protein